MIFFSGFLAILFALSSSASYHNQSHETHNYYVLHHDPTTTPLVDVAELLGLHIVERIGKLEDIWLARIPKTTLGTRAESIEEDSPDPVIESYQRMRRQTLISQRREDISLALKHLSRQLPQERVLRAPLSADDSPSSDLSERARVDIEDPLFNKQWSLATTGNPDSSLNVVPVWEMGFTGKGTVIAIIDSGIMGNHKDIESNYAAEHSYDFLAGSRAFKIAGVDKYVHGTACAGVIAAVKNDLCGVGIAYDSKVASLRLLDPPWRTDAGWHTREASAFNHHYEDVSIYSGSYGLPDDGMTLDGPSYVANQALLNGVNNGRGGKGSIYVFAAGNGGDAEGDECNYDGYANSIYTITIGAVDKAGRHAAFSESCTAVMASAYSGASGQKSIVTLGTNNVKECREDFGSTSAAAPAAAAIFALALEARPELSWRDIQYLCVKTARVIDDGPLWETLKSGRKYSDGVGFGVLDAFAFVTAARDWSLVKPQVWMKPPPVVFKGGSMKNGVASGGMPLNYDGVSGVINITPKMTEEHDFETIEHVQVRVWVKHERRGDIEVSLTGPGPDPVTSTLGRTRPGDDATTGLMGWTFSTLMHWGERPTGKWTVTVNDQFESDEDTPESGKGVVLGFAVTFWGCAKDGSRAKPYSMPADDYNDFPPPKR